MCKAMEERCKDAAEKAAHLKAYQMVMNFLSLGTVSKTDISKASGFTLEEIDEIEKEMSTSNA